MDTATEARYDGDDRMTPRPNGNRMIPDSPAFHDYIAPAANGRSAWWRVLLGLSVVIFFWFGGSIALVTAISAGWLSPIGIGPEAMAFVSEGRAMPPQGVMAFLLTFLGIWIGLWVALRLLHRRRFGTLYGPSGRPFPGNVVKGAALALVFHAITLATWSTVVGPPERTALGLDIWALWIVPVLLGVMMQATSEELLFRGYILQQFAVWSRNPLVWAVVPALVFTALHYDAGMEAGMRWRVLVHILTFGLITALLVWRTGGLGAAIGLHVMNNIIAISVFGLEGAGFGFELWLFEATALERMFPFDMGLTALMAGAALLFFRPEERA